MEVDGEDEGFDLIQPTLIQQLRKILDEYPDDGQILKELIQNAEDAGAKQVKFLYDKHSFGTDKLFSKGLAQFQGPALYAYNDATFSKDDWKGIRMICDSIKVKDPMKVGRFGLGFKSVFHLTDLPSILSDKRIGFIDPHEEHFNEGENRRTGFDLGLKKVPNVSEKMSDQFLPYKGIFDCTDHVFDHGHYKGTLFRFPLRAYPSELSQTVYSEDKVEHLFKSFINDAHLVLLFLRNIEVIELYIRKEFEEEPRCIFQVKIGDESLDVARSKRRAFFEAMTPGQHMPEPVTETYPLTILKTEASKSTERHSYLVTNYCCGGEVSDEFKKLLTDDELSYLPSVGVAMALPSETNCPTPDISGHVFCVLPLPVQTKSMTGLPVHVNGFFALSQNRRHIKTPNADQEERGELTDKSLLWNCCLIEEAVPAAYAALVLQAIDNNESPESIYKAWPNISSIDQTWMRLKRPLLKILCSDRVIHTKADGGKWLYVKEAIFDRIEEKDPKKLLQSVMLVAHQNVATLPTHVLQSIDECTPIKKEITPSFVRCVLATEPTCYKFLDKKEKLSLLKFVLKDDRLCELVGLELLPISDGNFAYFSKLDDNSPDKTIFITSPEHPPELLPTLRDRLLDQCLEDDILRQLEKVAKKGCTQLTLLTKYHVPHLLREMLTGGRSNSDELQWSPTEDWLRCIWEYLSKHFKTAEDLSKMNNLPLVPLELSKVTLTKLKNPSKIVVQELGKECLEKNVKDVLERLGVLVLKVLPDFLSNHPSVVGTYVHRPSAHGVLKAMAVSASEMGQGMHSAILLDKKVTDDEKRSLRKLLSESSSLNPEEKRTLNFLPLFETVGGSQFFVSKKDVWGAAPEDAYVFPVAPLKEKKFVDTRGEDSRRLARLLNIQTLATTDFLVEGIFPCVHNRTYSDDEIDKLMDVVIKRYDNHAGNRTRFEEEMRTLRFVSTKNGRVSPKDIFDPRNDLLCRFFADEDVFPVGDQYNDPSVLAILKKLGMKSEADITTEDLYHSARKISEIPDILVAESKAEAVIAYLESNPSKLEEPVNEKPLGELLQESSWVRRVEQKPDKFPKGLPFCGEAKENGPMFFKPSGVYSHENVNLIGSVKPIVKTKTSSKLAKYFGWDKKPQILDVVKHLNFLVNCYTQDEKPLYMLQVQDVYNYFLSHAEEADLKCALEEIRNSRWIWNGDGFSFPSVMLSKKPSLDLSPYIYSLPQEMIKYSELFFRSGMPKECDELVLLSVLELIKEKYDQREHDFELVEVKRDLQLSIAILNEVKPSDGDQLPQELQDKVLIPTYVEGDLVVKLAPAENCVYCESEWDLLNNDDGDIQFIPIHPNVPSSTAELFNVRTLTNSLIDPDELSVGEEFGQEEKLTDRLNRLLEEYTDGFSVAKELIQNADDAGATEVRFLYDERSNQDALTSLMDTGMKGCQGPALWVYNDAEFRDEDFVNITKLNGGTKEQETEKIGKFGLGFNAVYNLTDVPMFLSRNYFVIFDPHFCYLGKLIRNKSKPGIKIDLNKNTRRLRKYRDQFKPFNNIFGCDLSLDKDDNSFHGTLFRFPLRTKEQARRSEIKGLHYSDQEIRTLLKMILDKAQLLLLFTQNVISLKIYSLSTSSCQTPQPVLLCQVNKSISQGRILRPLSVPVNLPITSKKLGAEQRELIKQSNFLQACSYVTKSGGSCRFPESSVAVEIECVLSSSGQEFFNMKKPPLRECETWLIVSSMGTGKAMDFARGDPALLPSAGVAVQLVPTAAGKFLPSPVVKWSDEKNVNGTIFCYLPLPIHSGLPVHINGAFAVTSNRRHLQEKLEDDKECTGVKWNNKLMEDSISFAYISLLEDVKSLAPDDDSYAFHSLWPKASEVTKVNKECLPIVSSFYYKLAREAKDLFFDGNEWVNFSRVVFLHPDLRTDHNIGEASFVVFEQFSKAKDVVIDLPSDVFDSFRDCGLETSLVEKTYDRRRFFVEVFFPNISDIRPNMRDVLVLHSLDRNEKDFDELLKGCACIPTTPRGSRLRCPGQLVNPKGEAAALFCGEDGRFPCGDDTFLKTARLEKLEELGMTSEDLPWEDIAERTESVKRLNAVDSKAALKRVKAILKFMEKKLKRQNDKPPEMVLRRLLTAPFLPVLQKPESFPLTWKADHFVKERKPLVPPKDIFLVEKKYLVCCTELLADCKIPPNVKLLLKLEDKEVTTQHVIKQLENAISLNTEDLIARGYEEVRHVCNEAYSFFQDRMTRCPHVAFPTRFILVGKRFFSPDHVAFEVKADCSPYLNKLPENLAEDYCELFKLAGVRKEFHATDYISSLRDVHKKFHEMQLDELTLQAVINMVHQLSEALKQKGDPSPENKYESICLPDSRGVMRYASDLCVKDCPWMPEDPEEQFVHERISWPICTQLGVKTHREEALQNHDVGFPFGQKEKLTNRLKRILESYPGNKEILKELLQNADDAQATEICFVKDPRYHRDQKVFADSWKPIQGPALCVYNNKPFTNADIKGICSLGEGSKGHDPNKTGQYGVGFNAVYHLTDVPSFISKGEEIGDVLCVFDPHCKYVRHSTEENPGRMFRNISTLKEKFPDVFFCYLEDIFPLENGTLFRFPLRSEKMAKQSRISQIPVTVAKLDAMMRDLEKELFEVLLFVNNVKKISISEINEKGILLNCYSVEVIMSEEDEKKRQEFSDYLKAEGKRVRTEKILPSDIKVKRYMYTMRLRDNLGNEENWLIVQQVGFEKPVGETIIRAFRDDRLGMLPRGGVACFLGSNNSSSEDERKKKAFCFLPLPLETDLPVHINGHFALDHESRRSLWRDEESGYRSDWNKALLSDVIASCYLTLLTEARVILQLPVSEEDACHPFSSRTSMLSRLSAYEKLFPTHPNEDPYWRIVVNSVYQKMDTEKLRLLPVVKTVKARRVSRAKISSRADRVQLTWFPPTGRGMNMTFFNNLEIKGCFAALPPQYSENEEDRQKREDCRFKEKTELEETFLETGVNLVALSMDIFNSFIEAGVDTRCVSPGAVMDLYKSFNKADQPCKIGLVPCHVSKSPFQCKEGVIRVLKYCKDEEHFVDNLSLLPLLLTDDFVLNIFSKSEPTCLSQYQDILPKSQSLFVHKELRRQIFNSVDSRASSVFRPLDVEIFSSQLPCNLPPHFRSEDHYAEWLPDVPGGYLPNRDWIYRVWRFLHEFVDHAMKEAASSEETVDLNIPDLLSPLSSWAILPATETKRVTPRTPGSENQEQTLVCHLLVPLSMAESVVDFTDCGELSRTLVEILRNLGLPELNWQVLTQKSSGTTLIKRESYDMARQLVASLRTPHSLITVLKQKLKTDPRSLDETLTESSSKVVLAYFSRHFEYLKEADKETLRKLPFFPTAGGTVSRLEGNNVFLLPQIPKNGMCVIEKTLGCLFLESCSSLSELYTFLGVKSVTPMEVYTQFILQCFSQLSQKGRLAHLQYLRQFVLLENPLEKDEEKRQRERLLECLKMVEFIPAGEGTLKTASNFYDPENEVFHTMLSDEKFPPTPFSSHDWLPFLKKVGLVAEVSKGLFLEYAKQVAHEAETARTEKTKKKSEILVGHLISRPNVVSEGLLSCVRHVPFVAADPVSTRLQNLCPPFAEKRGGNIPYIAFERAVVCNFEEIVWTKANLLPSWADPRNRRFELDCPPRKNRDNYLSEFLLELQVIKKPSVDIVVRHCQTFCSYLQSNYNEEGFLHQEDSTITEVMEKIYIFLQEHLQKGSPMGLQSTSCILVEEGRKFILPKQAVLEMYEHLEIKPFLYRIPLEFGKFRSLFEFLGCSKNVNTSHYAMVLTMLQQSCKSASMHPNEIHDCSKAVKGFFDKLQDDDQDVASVSTLYLPAMSAALVSPNASLTTIPVSLHKATDLIFDDAPTYGTRIKKLDRLMVLDLSHMDVNCKSFMMNHADLMMKLPLHLRPKFLSLEVKEKVRNPDDKSEVKNQDITTLRLRLSSLQFGRGIARIIRHAKSQRKDIDESVFLRIEKRLRSIQLYAVERLETSLFHNNVLIEGSEAMVPYFQETFEDCGENVWKIYINTETGMSNTISTTSVVTDVIVKMYGEYLGKKSFIISEMLRCSPSSIWSLLDTMNIRKDDSISAQEMGIYPEPGTLIPVEDHHLLNNAFEEFEQGEYVGYQLDDPSLQLKEGLPIYIYAIVIDMVFSENADCLKKQYKISIGHNKEAVVKAVNLYKFHRPQEIFDEQGGRLRNKQEVFLEISNLIRDAWELPEEERRLVIKRLCLRWNPINNPGDEEFYREAFQHIKNEVSRLGGSYEELFATLETRAREHTKNREVYKTRFTRTYGSSSKSWRYISPSFCERNRQPGEAKRWFRQAEADLKAGENEIASGRPSYEWVCFKCHQAAEKALKAAQYDYDANKTNVHNLVQNCRDLDDSELCNFAGRLENLVGDSTHMRYPDRMCYPQIPNDVYNEQKARKALEFAQKVVERVKNRIL